MISDCLSMVHELAIFFKNSPNRSRILQDVSSDMVASDASLKPLCPTRWSVRAKSISSVLKNYAVVLESLSKIAVTNRNDSGTKAHGFKMTLERFDTFFALTIALTVFEIVGDCNVNLQSKSLTLSSAKLLAKHSVQKLQKLRSDSEFTTAFQSAVTVANELDIGPPQVPKVRRVCRRLDDRMCVMIAVQHSLVHQNSTIVNITLN